MKQIALTIEQMNKLESLGLDTSGASMFYYADYGRDTEYKFRGWLENYPEVKTKTKPTKDALPFIKWTYTLQDILKKLPKVITIYKTVEKDSYELRGYKNCKLPESQWKYKTISTDYYLRSNLFDWINWEHQGYFGDDVETIGSNKESKTFLEEAYNALVWCLENNYIKTK